MSEPMSDEWMAEQTDKLIREGKEFIAKLKALTQTVTEHAASLQREATRRCSFCDKPREDVKFLIAGPGVYICDECIELCNEIARDMGLKGSDEQ